MIGAWQGNLIDEVLRGRDRTPTERLPLLVGRGRALEIILGGNDFDGDIAERSLAVRILDMTSLL